VIEEQHISGQSRGARNLRLRGRRWWARFRVRGRRCEKSLETDNLKVARERLRFLMALHTAGLSIFPEDILVDVALAKWEASLLARRTVKSARTDIARVRRFFETAQVSSLGKVSPALLADFLDKLRAGGLSPKTGLEYRNALHGFYRFALERVMNY